MVPLGFMWGLLVLCVAAASPPRYARQAELDNYDDNNVDGDEVYEDFYDGSEPVISTLEPYEDIDLSYSASLEEKEEEEILTKPPLIPSRSGESGTLMGPSAQGEESVMPTDILQISGDLGSGDAVPSGDLPDNKASGSGENSGSGSSGASGEISGSVDSEDLSSGVSGFSGSDITFTSSGEEELHLNLELDPLEASGDFEESGIPWMPRASGFHEGSGEPVSSGVPEVSGGFETSGNPEESGESGVPEGSAETDMSSESGVPEGSAEPGASGVSDASGESGEPEVSGESGTSGLPEMSGEPGISGELDFSGESGISGVPDMSGQSETSGEPDISGEPEISEVPVESGEPETSGVPVESGELQISEVPDESRETESIKLPEEFRKPRPFDIFEESGDPEESGESGSLEDIDLIEPPDDTTTVVIPILDEEEEIFLTTPTTPLEGTGGDIGSGIPDIDTDIDQDTKGMSVCMLCTCLVGSVYCDDLKLDRIPPLSKETTHFYARYNKVSRISKSDFANLNKLKKIDLTSNSISRIDDDAFFGLPSLEELILRENSIRQLPALPPSMTLIDASHNQLGSTGIQREAFKDMPGLLYLYLTDNNIDHIPVPLPESLRSLHLQNNNIQMIHEDTFCNPHDLNYIRNALEDIRLDGNPINLSRTPQAYICLPRIPIGTLI